MAKKTKNFKNYDSLKPVIAVVNEAAIGSKDPRRTITNSAIPEVLSGALGSAIGGAASFTALWALGSGAAAFSLSGAGIMGGLAAAGGIIGGGAVAGLFVLAAPAVVLASTGVGVATYVKNKKFLQEKDRLYKVALEKHNDIIIELSEKEKLSKDRIDYLNSLNILLRQAIKDLKSDLGFASQ